MSRLTRYKAIPQGKLKQYGLSFDRQIQHGTLAYYVNANTVKVSIIIDRADVDKALVLRLSLQEYFKDKGISMEIRDYDQVYHNDKLFMVLTEYYQKNRNKTMVGFICCLRGVPKRAQELLDKKAARISGEEDYNMPDMIQVGLQDLGLNISPVKFTNEFMDKILTDFQFNLMTPNPTEEYEALTQKYLQLYNSDQWIRYGRLD